ncbi:MAG: DUF190 domain-containing protein [Anaerolineales bacterium]
MAGATVLRGMMGYGANSREIQTFKFTCLSEDLPIVVEIVDTKDRLDAYLESVDESIQAGMVTLEKATVRIYRANGKK